MFKVKVHPVISYLYAFLQTRGFLLVKDKESVLHYTGDNLKELKALLKRDRPDLLILHSQSFFQLLPVKTVWVYHPAKTEKQFLRTRKLYTNSFRLCQLYYQKLGIQAEIKVIPSAKAVKTAEISEPKVKGLGNLWVRICRFMSWE